MKLEILLPFNSINKYLFESIDSLVNSDFDDFNITLLDDRTTFHVNSDLSSIIRLPRISYLRTNKQGYGDALNLGISHSNSEYIALMNADDITHPQRFKKQIFVFDNFDVDVVSTRLQKFRGKKLIPQLSGDFSSSIFNPMQLLFGSYSANASCMFKTAWIKNRSKFAKSDMADFFFGLENYPNARIYHIHEYLYFYRQHNQQTTAGKRETPEEFFNAWNYLSSSFKLPQVSKTVISILSLPAMPTNLYLNELNELNEWLNQFFRKSHSDFELTSSEFYEFREVIFRRLIAMIIRNPWSLKILLDFYDLTEFFRFNLKIVTEIFFRKHFDVTNIN